MSDSRHDEFDPYEYADQLGYSDELGRGDHSDPTSSGPRARRRADAACRGASCSSRAASAPWRCRRRGVRRLSGRAEPGAPVQVAPTRAP